MLKLGPAKKRFILFVIGGWILLILSNQVEEFRLYQKMFDVFCQQLTPPDIVIYLHAPVNRLQGNIKKRNRKFEQSIPDEYLFKLQETYTSYIKQHNIKTIFVDASNADFIGNEAHVDIILDALEKDLDYGQHYFTLP